MIDLLKAFLKAVGVILVVLLVPTLIIVWLYLSYTNIIWAILGLLIAFIITLTWCFYNNIDIENIF